MAPPTGGSGSGSNLGGKGEAADWDLAAELDPDHVERVASDPSRHHYLVADEAWPGSDVEPCLVPSEGAISRSGPPPDCIVLTETEPRIFARLVQEGVPSSSARDPLVAGLADHPDPEVGRSTQALGWQALGALGGVPGLLLVGAVTLGVTIWLNMESTDQAESVARTRSRIASHRVFPDDVAEVVTGIEMDWAALDQDRPADEQERQDRTWDLAGQMVPEHVSEKLKTLTHSDGTPAYIEGEGIEWRPSWMTPETTPFSPQAFPHYNESTGPMVDGTPFAEAIVAEYLDFRNEHGAIPELEELLMEIPQVLALNPFGTRKDEPKEAPPSTHNPDGGESYQSRPNTAYHNHSEFRGDSPSCYHRFQRLINRDGMLTHWRFFTGTFGDMRGLQSPAVPMSLENFPRVLGTVGFPMVMGAVDYAALFLMADLRPSWQRGILNIVPRWGWSTVRRLIVDGWASPLSSAQLFDTNRHGWPEGNMPDGWGTCIPVHVVHCSDPDKKSTHLFPIFNVFTIRLYKRGNAKFCVYGTNAGVRDSEMIPVFGRSASNIALRTTNMDGIPMPVGQTAQLVAVVDRPRDFIRKETWFQEGPQDSWKYWTSRKLAKVGLEDKHIPNSRILYGAYKYWGFILRFAAGVQAGFSSQLELASPPYPKWTRMFWFALWYRHLTHNQYEFGDTGKRILKKLHHPRWESRGRW